MTDRILDAEQRGVEASLTVELKRYQHRFYTAGLWLIVSGAVILMLGVALGIAIEQRDSARGEFETLSQDRDDGHWELIEKLKALQEKLDREIHEHAVDISLRKMWSDLAIEYARPVTDYAASHRRPERRAR